MSNRRLSCRPGKSPSFRIINRNLWILINSLRLTELLYFRRRLSNGVSIVSWLFNEGIMVFIDVCLAVRPVWVLEFLMAPPAGIQDMCWIGIFRQDARFQLYKQFKCYNNDVLLNLRKKVSRMLDTFHR